MGTITAIICILIIMSVIFRLKGRKGERKMLDRDREVFEAEIVDSPLDVTERRLEVWGTCGGEVLFYLSIVDSSLSFSSGFSH